MFFTILYLVSTALSLPIGTFLTFLGGYIFGVFIGFFLVVIGATLGAVILFLIIKIGFIKSVESIQRKPGLLNKIKLGIEKDIWSYLFFIRFFPVFPFWFVNIAPAILGVRFFPYLVILAFMQKFFNSIFPSGQWSLKRIVFLFFILGLIEFLFLYLK